MQSLPPPPLPNRPDLAPIDLPPRRRFPAWVVVVAVLLGLSLAAAALAPLFQSAERDPGPGFQFLSRTAAGSPTRWNPCEPIHYVVNAGLAPLGSLGDVQEAVSKISAATGIAFVYEGPTDEQASVEREVFQPDRYGDRWAPDLIAWTDPDTTDIPFEDEDHVAAAVAVPLVPPTTDDVYVSGWIAVNADDPNPPGFDLPGEQGPVVLHELGHLLGLGHVRSLGEIMHPSGGGVVDLGPGDREGLHQLGASGGCVAVPEPSGG